MAHACLDASSAPPPPQQARCSVGATAPPATFFPCEVQVTVHEARGLQAWNQSGRCDPRVWVTVWDPELHTVHSETCVDTKHPKWECVFCVRLDGNRYPEPRLHLRVEDDEQGFDSVLGEVCLGLRSTDVNGLPQWRYLAKWRGWESMQTPTPPEDAGRGRLCFTLVYRRPLRLGRDPAGCPAQGPTSHAGGPASIPGAEDGSDPPVPGPEQGRTLPPIHGVPGPFPAGPPGGGGAAVVVEAPGAPECRLPLYPTGWAVWAPHWARLVVLYPNAEATSGACSYP